ncbi:uncharacterized protein LOC116164816 isoform X2 [Photinus pyralis]|nr:uncharacterized protein LOC116164816 isoform X2 [Photinus pyralis]
MYYCKKVVRNPPLPSPWKSTPPVGYKSRQKWWLTPRTEDKFNLDSVPEKQWTMREDALFFSLNLNTLILAFPYINQKVIEDTLTACGNSLSGTINVLKSKNSLPARRFIQRSPVLQQNKTKGAVTYIPTKYEDVQIVEINTPPAANGWSNASGAPKIRVANLKMLKAPPKMLPKTVYSLHVQPIVPFIPFEIPQAVNQNKSSIPSQLCKVEKGIQKHRHNVESDPNHVLERTLTFYPSREN